MKLGMPTLVEYNSIEENAKLCEKLGLQFVELNMDLPYCLPEKMDWKKIKENYDIDFTIHLSEKIEIGDIYELSRKNQLKLVKKQIEYFHKEAGITKYNLHLDQGVYFNLPDKKIYIFEKYQNEYETALEDSLKELSNFAIKENIQIYFENVKMTNYLINSFEKVTKYPNLYYTLDVGHDAKDKGIAESIFMKNPDKLKHMHIHDFNGEKNHKELGTGTVNVKKYLDFCEQKNIYAVIEVKREQELANSIEYIKKLIK